MTDDDKRLQSREGLSDRPIIAEEESERNRADCAYERFLEYKKERERDAEIIARARMRDKTESRKKSGKHIFPSGTKGTVVKIASAFAAVILVFSSAVGTRAGKDDGFFYWLKKDDTGVTMITSPENLDEGTVDADLKVYNSKDQAPEAYREYVADVGCFDMLEGFELEKIEIVESKNMVLVLSDYSRADENALLTLGTTLYADHITINRETYEDYIFIKQLDEGGTSIDVYFMEEKSGVKYFLTFFHGDKKYFVRGIYDLEFMEALVKEYLQVILSEK